MAMEQRSYIATIWHWLRDVENRKVVAWIGSGLLVLLGGLLYQNVAPTSNNAAPSQSATANRGVATVGDVKVEGDVVINDGLEEDAESTQR